MIYFAKSNYLLYNHRVYYKTLENALSILTDYQKSIRKINKHFPKCNLGEQELTGDVAEKILQVEMASNFKEYQEICDYLGSPDDHEKGIIARLEQYLLDLKLFQSFEGKINFQSLLEIFNYENEVYFDKKFLFSQLPTLDKKLIPEVMSSAFSILFFNKSVRNSIRRPLEQYLIGLMSNMNYHYFSSAAQLDDLIKDYFEKNPHMVYIIGACPANFNGEVEHDNSEGHEVEYHQILVERIGTYEKIKEHTATVKLATHGLFLKESFSDVAGDYIVRLGSLPGGTLEKKTKLDKDKNITKDNVEKIMNNYYDGYYKKKKEGTFIPDKKDDLIIVTSTFHIYKTALEIERWFFRENISIEKRPYNIVIIGNETFYELMSHKDDYINNHLNGNKLSGMRLEQLKTMRKKKIKNFMFEVFQHALDKNSFKQ